MTEKKKRTILIAAAAGILGISILASTLFSQKTAQPEKSSRVIPASSIQSSSSAGEFLNSSSTASGNASSANTTDHSATLLQDAQKILHLRYDLSDTSVPAEDIKQYLRDYMTEPALNQMFATKQAVKPKAAVPAPSPAAPSKPPVAKPAPEPEKPPVSKPAAPGAPKAASSQAPASSDPAITYRPISVSARTPAVTPVASYAPVEKLYSYAKVQRIYTHALADDKQNVLLYYSLIVAGANVPETVSNQMMSLDMFYDQASGHWKADALELDTKIDYSLSPFQTQP